MHKWGEVSDAQQPGERTPAAAEKHTSKASVMLAHLGVKCLPGERSTGPAPQADFDEMLSRAMARKQARRQGRSAQRPGGSGGT